MKGKILKVTIVAAFALIAGMNVYNAQKSDVMSDLALANVEALAQSEGSGSSGCRYRMASRCGVVDSSMPWRPVMTIYEDHYFRKHNVYRLRIIFVTDKSKNTEKYEELYILFIITRIEHILHS